MHNRSATACLVGDIGGTHARFALAGLAAAAQRPVLEHAITYRVSEFATPGAALRRYLESVPAAQRPQRAVLGVASAVTDDEVAFTNNTWTFSIAALREELRLADLHVLNDFAAIAWALPALAGDELESVGGLSAVDAGLAGVRVVLGPGTGLGLGAVATGDEHVTVLHTEGGHIGFAPRDAEEAYLLSFLAERYGRVSYERVLCGDGLFNVYDAICARSGTPPQAATPEGVSQAARQGVDACAVAAVRACWSMLGAYAGDVALMYGAWQGVYLAGGVVSHLLELAGPAAFRVAFEDKGRVAAPLRKTPTLRIVRGDVGNLGAATYARTMLLRNGEGTHD